MRLRQALFVACVAMMWGAGAAAAEDVVGKWRGDVKSPDGDIPLVLTVTKDSDGKLAATGESPSQQPGVQIPGENVNSDGSTFSFDVAAVAGSYASKWDDERKVWAGFWSQNGLDLPLDLARTE